MTLRFDKEIVQDQLRQELASEGFSEAVIQRTGEGDYIIRTQEITTEEKQSLTEALQQDAMLL